MTPKHPNLGLKAMLYIFSYSQDEGSPLIEKASELSNLIETVIVNNQVPMKYRTKSIEDEGLPDPSEYFDKIHRDKYKNEQLGFLDRLKSISIRLKNQEVDLRNDILRSKLREVNRWLIKELRTWEVASESDYEVKFHGIMIPLLEGDDSDPFLIVNLIPELARCFNTKQRCPINIVIETVNFSEARKKRDELDRISEEVYDAFEKDY